MGDARINTTSARNPQGPLPALNAVTAGPPGSSIAAEVPPSRGQSVSPSQSARSDVGGANPQPRSSLSSILHASSDYNGSNSNAASSPRAHAAVPAAPTETAGLSEDTRALRMLDRSAFRQTVA